MGLMMEERDPGGGGTERDTADVEHIWRNIEQVGGRSEGEGCVVIKIN